MDQDHSVKLVNTEAQPVISVRKISSLEKLPEDIGNAYSEIIAYLGELGEQPSDMPFVAYYNMDMEELDVEIGFPVRKELPSKGDMAPGSIPAGKKAIRMHKGPYKEMAPVYEDMTKWIAENGLQPTGVAYEFYYNSIYEVPESELLTRIMFLIK